MKKILLIISLWLAVGCVYSQQLSQVTFSGGANLTSIAFIADQNVLIRISEDGKLIGWGIEVMAQRYNFYAPELQPYLGRVDYYGPEGDSVSRGKVKSIGTCFLTYYGHYETPEKVGKIKTIGSLPLDYYSRYDNTALKGKLRFVGSFNLEYYSSFENAAFSGKLKTIGNTSITYYSTFDDKIISGKIKSIGMVKYTWYTSYDRREIRGGLKTGSYRQEINRITYILQ